MSGPFTRFRPGQAPGLTGAANSGLSLSDWIRALDLSVQAAQLPMAVASTARHSQAGLGRIRAIVSEPCCRLGRHSNKGPQHKGYRPPSSSASSIQARGRDE